MAPKRPTRQRKAPALLKQETPKKQSNKSQAKEKKAAAKKQKELDARAKSVLASLAPFCVNLAAILVTLFMAGNPAAAGVALALSAIVRTGPGLPPALCVMILMAFVGPDKLIKPHDHVFWKGRRPFAHFAFDRLYSCQDHMCRLALHALRRFLERTWLKGGAWVISDIYLVASLRNGAPWHQDRMTGRFSYDRGGFRVLYNVGPFPGVSSGLRLMAFGLHLGQNFFYQLFGTRRRMVAMDGAAAGSAEGSLFFHARFGSGLTLVVDVVPRRVSGVGLETHNRAILNFFHPSRRLCMPRAAANAPPPPLTQRELAEARSIAEADPYLAPAVADHVARRVRETLLSGAGG